MVSFVLDSPTFHSLICQHRGLLFAVVDQHFNQDTVYTLVTVLLRFDVRAAEGTLPNDAPAHNVFVICSIAR